MILARGPVAGWHEEERRDFSAELPSHDGCPTLDCPHGAASLVSTPSPSGRLRSESLPVLAWRQFGSVRALDYAVRESMKLLLQAIENGSHSDTIEERAVETARGGLALRSPRALHVARLMIQELSQRRAEETRMLARSADLLVAAEVERELALLVEQSWRRQGAAS